MPSEALRPYRLQPSARVRAKGATETAVAGRLSHYEPDGSAYVVWDDRTISKVKEETLDPEIKEPEVVETITLTKEEAKAIYSMIVQLSGGNPEYAFVRDGSDTMDDPTTSATVKIYRAAGREDLIPDNLQEK